MTDLVQLILSSGDALTAQSKRLYVEHVREFVKFCGPLQPTGVLVETWRDKLRKQGLAPQSVNNHLWAVKFASKRLAELNQNPQLDFARYARPLREQEPERRKALDIDGVKKILATCAGQDLASVRDRTLITFAARTGLRRGGLCALKIEDIRGRRVKVTLKGEREDEIIIDDETANALQEWIARLRKYRKTSGPLFVDIRSIRPNSKALSEAGIYKIFRDRAAAVGIKAFPHLFRHTAISLLTAAGEPTWRIQRLTGQKTAAIVDRYRTDYEEESRPVSSSISTFKPTDGEE